MAGLSEEEAISRAIALSLANEETETEEQKAEREQEEARKKEEDEERERQEAEEKEKEYNAREPWISQYWRTLVMFCCPVRLSLDRWCPSVCHECATSL